MSLSIILSIIGLAAATAVSLWAIDANRRRVSLLRRTSIGPDGNQAIPLLVVGPPRKRAFSAPQVETLLPPFLRDPGSVLQLTRAGHDSPAAVVGYALIRIAALAAALAAGLTFAPPGLHPVNPPPVTYDLTVADVATISTLTMANEILLKIGDASSSPVSGNFYAIREPAVVYASGEPGDPWTGASHYRDAIGAPCQALTHSVGVGDWMQAEQGNMQGPTRSGVATLCGIAGNPQSFRCTPPVPIQLVIWDIADRSVAAPNAFRVKYLGAFAVTGFSRGSGGTPDGVTGYFQSLVSMGGFNPQPGLLRKTALVQ